MKKVIYAILAISFLNVAKAQIKYDNTAMYGDYQPSWAMVTINHKLGFIDKKGKEIVKPIYDYIGHFGEVKPNLASVTLGDKKGFIDRKGNFITE